MAVPFASLRLKKTTVLLGRRTRNVPMYFMSRASSTGSMQVDADICADEDDRVSMKVFSIMRTIHCER